MLEKNKTNITQKFTSSFRWNIAGSVAYEVLKVLHQTFLLYVVNAPTYGLIGSVFSIIYLIIYLTKLGVGDTLAPFLNIFIKSKQNFKHLFIKTYVLPQLLFFACAAVITTYFYSKSFFNNPDAPFLLLIPLTITFEGMRIFLRRFLHTVFLSKATVIVETLLAIFFYSAVWIPHLFLGWKMTTNLVFTPYLLDSAIAIIIFIFMVTKFYKTLPNKALCYPKNFWPRIFKARFFNYSTQVSKNFFTGNFLTPFFASQFGLTQAGIFNLANHIAEAIKSVMKVTILFSGNALLAKIKTATIQTKRQAFNMLGEKLNIIMYPMIIFLAINYKPLLRLKIATDITGAALLLTLTFLIITFMEHFFLIYEQFYIVEEQAHKLFVFKILEFALFYALIISDSLSSPLVALLGILILRTLTFSIIATNAYTIWKIKPNFKIKFKYLISYVVISVIFYLLLR